MAVRTYLLSGLRLVLCLGKSCSVNVEKAREIKYNATLARVSLPSDLGHRILCSIGTDARL